MTLLFHSQDQTLPSATAAGFISFGEAQKKRNQRKTLFPTRHTRGAQSCRNFRTRLGRLRRQSPARASGACVHQCASRWLACRAGSPLSAAPRVSGRRQEAGGRKPGPLSSDGPSANQIRSHPKMSFPRRRESSDSALPFARSNASVRYRGRVHFFWRGPKETEPKKNPFPDTAHSRCAVVSQFSDSPLTAAPPKSGPRQRRVRSPVREPMARMPRWLIPVRRPSGVRKEARGGRQEAGSRLPLSSDGPVQTKTAAIPKCHSRTSGNPVTVLFHSQDQTLPSATAAGFISFGEAQKKRNQRKALFPTRHTRGAQSCRNFRTRHPGSVRKRRTSLSAALRVSGR